MKINAIGPILGTTGYASHFKGLVNELGKIADVKISTFLQPNWERLVNDFELAAIMKEDSQDRMNLIVDMPQMWPLYLTKEKNACYCVWEGDKVPTSWIENFKDERVSVILVPSEHVRNAIKNTTSDQSIHKKIKVVPHGADRGIFYPEEKTSKTFKFLMLKGFRNPFDRGGVQHGIIAFMQEFKDEDVELFIKFNPAYAMPIEHFNAFMQQIGYVGKPKVSVSWDVIDQKTLRELYNQCDVFLNPTEGEAFSIPSLEALACGKAVISTDFGGQTDFLNKGNSWVIDYELHPVLHELAYEGVNWARPKIDSLRKAMREAYENREMTKSKGAKGLIDSKDLTWSNSAQVCLNWLKDI